MHHHIKQSKDLPLTCTYISKTIFMTGNYSSSDDGRREDLSDSSDDNQHDRQLLSLATPAEKYQRGLLMGKRHSRRNVDIREVEGRGRSAFASKNFEEGDFVCEYASSVRVKSMPDKFEERNEELGIGCYCLDATFKGTMYTFDGSSRLKDPGRYINHASRNCNLVKMKPVMVGNPPHDRLRMGFVAKKPIMEGEELFYDYGIRDPTIDWLITDAKKVGTSIAELEASKTSNAELEDNDKLMPPKKRVYRRKRKDCPIPNCGAKQLIKLADHIRLVHRIDDEDERRKWRQKAKEVYTYIYLCI